MLKDKLLKITDDEYFRRCYGGDTMTAHMLRLFARSPLLYFNTINQPRPADTNPAYKFGRAVHAYILQGEEVFNESFIAHDGPVNAKTGKPFGPTSNAYIEFFAAMNKTPVSLDEFSVIRKMDVAASQHKAVKLEGIAEAVLQATWNGVNCASKIDLVSEDGSHLVDLKSCDSLEGFKFDINQYNYLQQMGFYYNMLKLNGANPQIVELLAVEKKEPYRAGLFRIDTKVLDEEADNIGKLLDEYRECKAKNVWPPRFEDVVMISLEKIVNGRYTG